MCRFYFIVFALVCMILNTSTVVASVTAGDTNNSNSFSSSGVTDGEILDKLLLIMVAHLEERDRQIVQHQIIGSLKTKLASTIKGFGPESLIFYSAIGAMMVRKSYHEQSLSGGSIDPNWLENLVHEATSPIGIFSLFSFFIVNAATTHTLSRKFLPIMVQNLVGLKNIHSRSSSPWLKKIYGGGYSSPFLSRFRPSDYSKYRFSFRSQAMLFTQVGLAAGIFASNVVVTLGMLSKDPSMHRCMDSVLPSSLQFNKGELTPENAQLVCEEAHDDFVATFQSWGPAITGVLMAALLNGTFASLIITAAYKGKKVLKHLYPYLLSLIPGPITWAKIGTFSFRVFNLWTFMEIIDKVEYYITNPVNEKLRSWNFAKHLGNFMTEMTPPLPDKKGLDCEDEQEPDSCLYHSGVRSMYRLGSSFTRWREFQLLNARISQQKWLTYLSSATSSFDITYEVYKNFFEAQTFSIGLNSVDYFGGAMKENKPIYDVLTAFENSVELINDELGKKNDDKNPSSVKVVSSITTSAFLKHNTLFKLKGSDDQLFVLRALFNVANSFQPLKDFYDDFDTELSATKKIILSDSIKHVNNECKQSNENLQILNGLSEDERILVEQQMSQYENTSLLAVEAQIKHFVKQCNFSSIYEVNNLDELATDRLKNRILSAGIELLYKIVELRSKTALVSGISRVDRERLKKLKDEAWPASFIRIVRTLGENDIFVQLVKELHIVDEDGKTISIKSTKRGMNQVHAWNSQYNNKEAAYGVKYHPKSVRSLSTPAVADFLIASSLCGHNIVHDSSQSKDMLEKVRSVVSNKQTVEQAFPDMSQEEIIEQIPLFKRRAGGYSFSFLPPQVLGLDNPDIQVFCDTHHRSDPTGLYGHHLYDQEFTVGDKVYRGILDIAMDNIISKQFKDLESFDKWWESNIRPYQEFFLLLADQNYTKMMQTWFFGDLLENRTVDITVHHFQEETAEQTAQFFSDGGQFSEQIRNSVNLTTQYDYPIRQDISLSLPTGVIQNIFMEMIFWSKAIVLISNSPVFTFQDEEYRKTVQKHINDFIRVFNIPSDFGEFSESALDNIIHHSVFEVPLEMLNYSTQDYRHWLGEFVSAKEGEAQDQKAQLRAMNSSLSSECDYQPPEGLTKLQRAYVHLRSAALCLNINMDVLEAKQQSPEMLVQGQSLQGNVIEEQIDEQFTKATSEAIGYFYEKDSTVAQQQLNYMLMRLDSLILEFASYVEMVEVLSKNQYLNSVK